MSHNNRHRYSAHRNVKGRNFICNSPSAKQVSVVGDFNKWNGSSDPMTQGHDGVWTANIQLRHGHHRYAFKVDGKFVLDPTAMGITRDDKGERVSLIAVS